MDDYRKARDLEWLEEHGDEIYHIIENCWAVWNRDGSGETILPLRDAIKLARDLGGKPDA